LLPQNGFSDSEDSLAGERPARAEFARATFASGEGFRVG